VETFRQRHAHTAEGQPHCNTRNERVLSIPYGGQPFFVSEFGGTWWNPAAVAETTGRSTSWGYGNAPKTIDELYQRFEGLCSVLLDDPAMFGYCYTQLTDVYQEQNGIYTFDRQAKFDLKQLQKIQGRKAAIEKQP